MGHWGWLGASPPAQASVPGGIHQPHVNTFHRQLNHLSVSGLQSWWERLRREVLSPLWDNDLSPMQVGSPGASLKG